MRNPDEVEREAIVRALGAREGNRTRVAEELGMSRRTIFYKIKRHGLE
ncbi:MAG TPA: helix-turn-helix domain-containing protein [Spirochaetia bacterium]|nr:helix-turn-helix domain-containing protein [Spirochaetia bacterium]